MDKKSLLNSGLIESYVLGLCTGSERQLVEEWAQKDEEIACMLKSSRQVLRKFCRSRIRTEFEPCGSVPFLYPDLRPNTRKSPRIFNLGLKRTLSGVTVLVVFVFFALFGFKSIISEFLHPGSSHGLNTQSIDYELQRVPAKTLWFIENSQTIPIILSGSQEYLDASGTFYWNPYYNRGFIRVSSLPQTPRGKCFQLWADMRGETVNLGRIDQMIREPSVIPALHEKFKLNLTLEKNGRVTMLNNDWIVLTGSLP